MDKSDDSREKILRAAIQIFAEKGLAGASVRAITSAAGVNHALIGYYFGSKVALYEEVLERASVLIGRPKLKRLAELKEEFGKTPIPLSDLIDAYIRSFFDDFGNPKSVPRTWLRFYGRVFSEQDDEVNRATNRSVVHVRIAFLEELQRTLPELSTKELVYRLGAMIGTIAFWRGETGIMDDHFEAEELRHIDVDELIEEMITICCGVFTSKPARSDLTASKRKNQQATIQTSITSRNQTDQLSRPTARTSRRHRKRVGTES